MDLPEFPARLRGFTKGCCFQPVTHGYSGAEVFRLEKPGKPGTYLKIAVRQDERELVAEKARLEWLAGKLAVPEVLFYEEYGRHEFLLLTEIAGRPAFDPVFGEDLPRLVKVLAGGLEQIHAVKVENCPFDESTERKLAAARVKVLAGQVNEDDFDEPRLGRTAPEIFAELLAAVQLSAANNTQGNEEKLVFTHGDFCLPNIILDPVNWKINGFIDLGRAGVGDRYQDLALAVRSLSYNFNQDWADLLGRNYGLQRLDRARIEFFQLLDEFF